MDRSTERPTARAGVLFVAFAFTVGMLGTTLPTPLYGLYQQQFGFSNLLTTVIYAVYAFGVLLALLLFGRASDVLGRRPLLLAALATSALSAVLFLTDGGVPVLIAGRLVSGLSAGFLTGTGTVALVELVAPRHRPRAAMLATAVNMLGLGTGPLLAGLLAEYAPAPLRLPFLVDLALLAVAAVGVWRTPETVAAPRRELPRPQRPGVPPEVRPVFVPAALAVFAAFSVFGLLTAIEPGFLATLLHLTNRAVAGTVVFSMFAGSVVGQTALSRVPGRLALRLGCLVLIAGLGAIAVALATSTLAPLVLGTIVVGVGQGLGFRAGMTAISEASPAARRAETVSSFFVVAYVGISVPVILVGVAAHAWGLRTAGLTFTGAVALVALTAFLLLLRRR
ncbi:MFS transporter [Actinomadura rayongensis]|uniref:MFS transporter n=1 Tax=Actinomadura rayongensis TaxID=1429076 RepID=A0A6I4WDY2_9ACTN|nr:MFS transporter [Actinomadura rayongensis]MXQ66465.1 MFS transporter [Actinomadura rayongensis]